MITTIVVSIIGSGALSTIISAIITALSNRKSRLKQIEVKLDEIRKKQEKTEKDAVRTQLLLMISDYPEETKEILTLGEYYFGKLNSNWYMTSLFNGWLEKNSIAKPEWFNARTTDEH